MQTTSALRRQVLSLYKACLASAARCPEHVHRQTMQAYVQMKFRDKVRLRDPKAVSALLADATEELERMEYYHSMYRAAQAEKITRRDTGSTDGSTAAIRMASHCPNCNHAFDLPEARFCSLCGVQRPTLV
ncbi:Aste57867_19084 [Aphanomyces stellatus]|uniref:Aste57867_19084 protein n=1 Tax=Aphanomyces stellatus TaxID=120398 RepID=A0A485LBY0_9STRA|nr:hypothetical protein As57867_019020 [Aphanomyces stellatus]VFT95809.1 Aste57867_19084 [Aphanomyces stellatus]